MEKNKKIILQDRKIPAFAGGTSFVEAAFVIDKSEDNGYLLSYYPKTPDTECASNDLHDTYLSITGYSLKKRGLYRLSKSQARALSTFKPGSVGFRCVLNHVLKHKEIRRYGLNEEAKKVFHEILNNNFELVEPEVEKREEYLNNEYNQKQKLKDNEAKKSIDIFSKKIIDRLSKFK